MRAAHVAASLPSIRSPSASSRLNQNHGLVISYIKRGEHTRDRGLRMVKIGIMMCDRNRTCTGNKCFKSIIERDGAFAKYPRDEPIEVVGWIACGGCPGERLEYAPADMKRFGAEVIYLASCYLAGYPICPYIEDHKNYIEKVVGLPVTVGTHPMPRNYLNAHSNTGDWKRDDAYKWLGEITGNAEDADKYDSTNPDFLKNRQG
jgi:predicted metal-binding protein